MLDHALLVLDGACHVAFGVLELDQLADGGDGHLRDQDRVYARSGVLAVHTSMGVWVVPPQRAVWIPADTPHRVEMVSPVEMRTLYVPTGSRPSGPAECCVVNVTRLLRELVLHIVRHGMLDRTVPGEKRLAGVLLDQLAALPTVPLRLPMPADERARRVAALVRAHPAGEHPLAALARRSGASKRTLERIFVRETGMTFGRWRQQARLVAALQLLAGGEAVTNVALDVGYESPSAFIAMFKRTLGRTPSQFYGSVSNTT